MRKASLILFLLTALISGADAQRYRVTELKEICNPREWELAPVLYDSGFVYMSNKTIPSTKKWEDQEGNSLTNIYYAPVHSDTKLGRPKRVFEGLATNANDGPLSLAQNDQMMCLCLQNGFVNGINLPDNGNSGLYFSYKTDGNWGEVTPFPFNDADVNYSTPNLTSDGLTLYFSADGFEDSYGGWDIYVSKMEDGQWTAPENLGGTINTAETDIFPFIHSSGRLYFSSRGHNSLRGSFDIFYSNLFNGKWSEPINFRELNSFDDEVQMLIKDDFSMGYITRRVSKRGRNDYNIHVFRYPEYEALGFAREMQRNRFCFRLRENSLDTIDYSIFSYEWEINDTLKIPGHDIKFCFPGPGEYNLSFNVTNKVTDTVMIGVATLFLKLELMQQPFITTARDTVRVGEDVTFSSKETVWTNWEIEGYYWDFDEGKPPVKANGDEIRTQFEFPGVHRVVLGIKEQLPRNSKYEAERQAVFKDIVVLPAQ